MDRQLSANKMKSIDVIEDGNCLFRSLSVCLYNTENEHIKLRQSVIDHIVQLAADGKTLPSVSMDVADSSVRQQLAKLRLPGTWVGEDIILTAATFLQRPIHIYNYASKGNSTPLIYSPPASQVTSLSQICLAYYLPGHYRAVDVVAKTSGSNLN